MSRSLPVDLAERVSALTREFRSGIEVARPDPPSSAEEFVRLLGVQQPSGHGALHGRALDAALLGLWSAGHPFLFALVRQGDELRVVLGASGCDGGTDDVRSLITATVPGAELALCSPDPIIESVRDWPFGAAFAGVPTLAKGQGLSGLVRAMPTRGWTYLVLGSPIPGDEIQQTVAWYAEEARSVANLHLRQGTVEFSNQPLARIYHGLLTRGLSQWQRGASVGMWRTKGFLLADSQRTLDQGTTLLVSILRGKNSLPQPFQVVPCTKTRPNGQCLEAPTTELPSSLLAGLVSLPEEEVPGFSLRPRRVFAQAPLGGLQTKSVPIGHLVTQSGVQPNQVSVEADQLVRHVFISGLSGGGKTHTAQHLLARLWKDHRLPFLVIEPAKTEYRRLASPGSGVEPWVFTLGNEREAPFRINPFEVPEGVPVQTHIDLLRTLFQATFAGLYPPMPYLLEQALLDVYVARGWDLASDTGAAGRPTPTLGDVCARAYEVADSAGYDSQVTQNVRTALRVRIGSLMVGAKGHMLHTDHSLPMAELLARPTVLELSAIGDPELVAFLMGLLLIRLWEHCVWARGECSELRHVTLIEEAHRLLAHRTSASSPDASSVRSTAVESFCQLLTEVRAYGEGLVIVDQSPAKLHPDVLRGTSLKIVHRLAAEDDRRAVGGCMGMKPDQINALTSLRVGEAAVFGEGSHSSMLVQVAPHPPWGTRLSGPVDLRRHMRPFFSRFPGWLSTAARQGPASGVGGDPLAMLAAEMENIILASPPDEVWTRLAQALSKAARAVVPADEVPFRALSLGLAAAERLKLPGELRAKMARNLSEALFPEEER